MLSVANQSCTFHLEAVPVVSESVVEDKGQDRDDKTGKVCIDSSIFPFEFCMLAKPNTLLYQPWRTWSESHNDWFAWFWTTVCSAQYNGSRLVTCRYLEGKFQSVFNADILTSVVFFKCTMKNMQWYNRNKQLSIYILCCDIQCTYIQLLHVCVNYMVYQIHDLYTRFTWNCQVLKCHIHDL